MLHGWVVGLPPAAVLARVVAHGRHRCRQASRAAALRCRCPKPQITRYQRFLRDTQGLQFDTYDALWRWSVTDLEAFWRSIWQFFDLQSPTPYARVLGDDRMPGARWFDGAQVNYAQQVLRHVDALQAAGHPAILFADEPMLAAGPRRRAVVGRLAAPGGCVRGGAQAPRRARAAIACAPTCRTGPRPRWCSSPAPAWARSGRSVRPTWARSPCSTASGRSSPRC